MPAEMLLRMVLWKHLHDWRFQETEDQEDQNLILRWFYRLGWHKTPDDTTPMRWAYMVQFETQHQLVDRAAEPARQTMVTKCGARCARTGRACRRRSIT